MTGLLAFGISASLRHEVDLNQLNEQLVAIVQETMQPAQVSLWLRSSSRDGTQNTEVWGVNRIVANVSDVVL